jgi:benzodiazapine receptor
MNNTNREWYEKLNKSTLTPPSYVFGIVWPILYILIITSGIIFLTQTNNEYFALGLGLYIVQWVLNIVWSPLFFQYKQVFASFIVIITLIFVVGFTIIIFGSANKIAATVLIPYFIWISFAAYLNGYIWYNNPTFSD